MRLIMSARASHALLGSFEPFYLYWALSNFHGFICSNEQEASYLGVDMVLMKLLPIRTHAPDIVKCDAADGLTHVVTHVHGLNEGTLCRGRSGCN